MAMIQGFLRGDLLYGACHVLGDGTMTWLTGGIASSSKVADGTYDIVLFVGADPNEHIFLPTCISFGDVVVKADVEPMNDNLLRVRTGIGLALTDCDFYLLILRIRNGNAGETFTISPVIVPPEPPEATLFNCPVTVLVGDAVYLSGVLTVDKAFAGIIGQTEDSIGIVIAKPSPTTCLVIQEGLTAAIFGGLLTDTKYFLSDLVPGVITSVAPVALGTKIQVLGFAASPTQLDVHIDPTVVLN